MPPPSGTSVEIDRELRAAGLANIACGAVGGALANQSASSVGALRRLGVSNRRVAVVALLFVIVALIWPHNLANFVPTFVLGGLLLALGARRRWPLMTYDCLPHQGRG